MTRELCKMSNVELFELLETEPKTQCTACLSYWNIGIVCCTCGHFLQKETEANRNFVKYTIDLLSLSEYVIKKGRPHGHRYGKKPGDKEYYLANHLKKECKKKKFQGIHDRFLRDPEFRVRMIEHNRDKEVCRRWDVLKERCDLLIAAFGKILLDKTFLNSIYFVTDGSFTADGGLL